MGMVAQVRADYEPTDRYGCASKFAFDTKLMALAAAERVKRPTRKQPVRPYLCRDCGKWHLTSTSRRPGGR